MDKNFLPSRYLIWLGGSILFLSPGLFLFLRDITVSGINIFSPLSFSVLVGFFGILLLIAAGIIFMSTKSSTLKQKYNWINSAFLLVAVALMFLLEAHTRTSYNLLDNHYFFEPTDLTIPLLIISAIFVFMAKRNSKLG